MIETLQYLTIFFSGIAALAAAFAPFLTYKLTVRLENERQKGYRKFWIFGQLLQTRHTPVDPDTIKALNSIDVIFADSPKIKEAWGIYFQQLSDPRLNNDPGYSIRETAKTALLHEMAKELSKDENITQMDITRIYTPTILAEKEYVNSLEIRVKKNELERILSAFSSTQQNGTDISELDTPSPDNTTQQ